MVKIKRKVEMTHEEYAKYMIDRFGITSYESALIDNNIIDAPMEFEQTFTLKPMKKDDNSVIERSFKGVVIEVEEEITEDTHLDYLYVLTDAKDIHRCNNFTIKTASMVIGRDDLTFFTLIDNDLVKICDKGKLVE
ncbi:hypothetical protein [Staphylococcus nepalensis]|uniref:hypothetical protein n=1 Tax=Staphylococcus nepalensis TaxID=214473 RepID=UPI0011C9FFF6|nr:hypothetical protein [Staphylococcus nepalensis]